MLEHYDRKRSYLRYQFTAESFETVAKTFSMRVPHPIRSNCDGDSSIVSLCNIPPGPPTDERKPAMTHSEPDVGSEGSSSAKVKPSVMPQSEPESGSRTIPTSYILANPPSFRVESIEKNDATRMGPSLASVGLRATLSAGIADVVLTIADKSRKFMDALRSCFYRSET